VEDLPGQSVPAFLQVGLGFELVPVVGFVGQTQDVQGLGDPAVVADGVAERGGPAVPGQHADDVVGADGSGVDGADDPQDVLPAPLDPGEIDAATGHAGEGPVVSARIDAPHLLVGQVGQLRRVREPGEREEPEDDVAV
jgi:hypothetical protein